MKITDIYTVKFRSKSCIQRDPVGHAHPGPETDSVSTMYVIETDEGVKGYSLPEAYYRLNEGAAPEEWARGDVGDVTAGKTAAGTVRPRSTISTGSVLYIVSASVSRGG